MTKFAKLFPLIFLLDACIERYDLPQDLYVSNLVVDGAITNEAGPYHIQLSTSSKLDSINTPPVFGATVTIHDNTGTSEELVETGKGRYSTQDIQGVIGRQYWITVQVGEQLYYTEPQQLFPPGYIDSLYYQFLQNSINLSDPIKPHHAIEVMVDSRGVEGYPNLLRWRWRSIHELLTHPQLRTREEPRNCSGPPDFPCPPLIVPNAPPCSAPPCECCRCWYERKSEISSVSNNRAVDGINFKGQQIARVAADDYFFIRTFIEVHQMSLSEEGYKFWDLVKRQQDGNENLFQPNTFSIPGNVKAMDPTALPVLGFFGVYGVAKKSMFVNPFDFPLYLEPPGIITETCRGTYPGASYEKPDFW